MTPLLRWAGSKRKNLDVLSAYWKPHHKRYLEPFAGSACLFFHLEPKRAIIGDLNEHLIETYEAIVDDAEQVLLLARLWPNRSSVYYDVRKLSQKSLTRFERAARFLYLNRFCFNGIWRTNKRGEFNVPYGGERSGQLPPLEALTSASKLLSRAKLVAGDFTNVVKLARAGDFVYLDPPYTTSKRRVFREYTEKEFRQEDVLRVREALLTLHRAGASFVLSYADCPEARAIAVGFGAHRIVVRRHIAGFAGHRRRAHELVVTNISPNDNE